MARGLRLALFSDTYAPQVNGVSRTLERLVAAVVQRGGEARVFTTSDPGASADGSVRRVGSVPFWAYPQLRIALPLSPGSTRDVRAWRPTLIHSATPFGVGLAGRSAARRLGVPFVSSYHTHFSAYVSFYRLGLLERPTWAFLRWFHNSGQLTFCPSRPIAAELEGQGFRHLRVWPRGIDTGRFNPRYRSEALRARLGATPDTTLVAYVGRIAPEKGLDVALDAMRTVMDAAPGKVVFAIAGDGPYEAHCRAAAPAGTVFTGHIGGEDLSALYASADLFIFPSVTDTFGNVLLEAMASGPAIVGAHYGTTTELLAAGRGVTFPPGDAGAMAEVILRLARQPDERAELSRAALDYARTASWEAVFDALIADYLTVHAPATATDLRGLVRPTDTE